MIYTCTIDTPLGTMTAAAKEEALVGLWFVGQKYYPSETDRWNHEPDLPIFAAARDYLGRYFSGSPGTPDIPLDPRGSPFQKGVWGILSTIALAQLPQL
jgi:methylated-DNA-[protein]-cysteine S-methyltransferase